jgi:type I restriction-modification system DNA methylase subunit
MEEIKLSENINNSGLTYSQSTYNEYYKTGKKDLFEEVIDSLMLNKYSDDKELVDYIKNLPNDKKRIAILSLLDGDNNLWSKINDRIKIGSKMDYIKDVVLMLREFVKVGEVEKKKYGEVMTPLDLVKDMLNTLPEDVWSNPNLKWLDPANGTGPFPIMVIYKLMNGLKYWEPDEEKRYKHIVENMIYTCELQDKNVFLWLCAVDPKDEYTTNTYWGSFLEEGFDKHMKEVWNVEKFDIVIGNPPYQIDGATGDNKLYLKFISKILNNDNRYLLFVTPKKVIENFTSPKNRDYITKKINFIKLSIDTPSLYFNNIGSSFCYFLIE